MTLFRNRILVAACVSLLAFSNPVLSAGSSCSESDTQSRYSEEVKKLSEVGDYEKIRESLEKKLEDEKSDGGARSDILMDIAGCYFNLGKFDQSQKMVEKALKIEHKPTDLYCPVEKYFNLAECLYFKGDFNGAIENYNEALKVLENFNVPKLQRRLNMSIASCYEALGKYEEAKPFQEEAVRLDRAIFGMTDLNYGWGLLKLSEIYKKLGDKRSEILYEKALWIFRTSNRDRLRTEYGVTQKPDSKESKEIASRIDKYIFGNKRLKDYDLADGFLFEEKIDRYVSKYDTDSLWRNQYEAREAPGIVWVDPGKPLSSIVIAVHGLGLHHGMYESFGRRIAKEGVMTIAFDVRGFGTYLESKGKERLNMDACVSDLRRIFDALARDYPDTPIYLLGESMGGAIVLRLGAMNPKGLAGIICSVPSGNRYESTGTKLRIGLNFLKQRNDLVDVAPYVVRHATTSKKLRKKWELDPSSRLRLSSKELLEFNGFMKKNAEFAKKINKLPVLIFQGDEDGLVKSKGTYDLFESVTSKDKTLVVVGGTEHLIFEAGQFRNGIALGVVGWLQAHSEEARKQQ